MKWYDFSKPIQRALVAVLGIFVMFPIVWVLGNSFESVNKYAVSNVVTFFARYISADQYKQLFCYDLEYWVAYWNSIFLTVPTVLLAICIMTMVAYGLFIIEKRISDIVLLGYALLSPIPIQIFLVPQLILINNMQLTGSRLAVILIGSCCPWYVFFLYVFLKRIPKDILEAARVEGAGEWTLLLRIVIPQIVTGICILTIVISSQLWGMVEEPLVYIQEPTKYPLSVYFHEAELSIPHAGVVVFTTPMILLFICGICEIGRREK